MDVKRICAVVLLAVATLLTWFSSWLYFSEQEPDESPYWWRGLGYSGWVERISPRALILRTPQGSLRFTIDSHTRILLVGDAALAPGTPVQVKYRNTSGGFVAHAIRVLKKHPRAPEADGSPKAVAHPEAVD